MAYLGYRPRVLLFSGALSPGSVCKLFPQVVFACRA